MNKDEILRKAQTESGTDERERQIQLKGSSIALWVGLLVCFGLMIVKIVVGVPYMDSYGVCMSMTGVQFLYFGRKLERKSMFWSGAGWCFLGLLCLVAYIVDIITG